MSYQKYLRPASGGQTQDNPGNYFGNGSLGSVVISSNTSLTSANDDSSIYEAHFADLTINSGITLNLGFRRRAWIVYVAGNLNVQGSITMSTGASAQASNQITIRRSSVNGFSTLTEATLTNSTSYIVPAAGAAGGAASGAAGNVGTAGTAGKTGGGGSGGGATGGGLGSGGAGGTGTAYSGGSAGGGGGYASGAPTNGSAGAANGGAGGNAGNCAPSGGSFNAGGGAGNPGGLASNDVGSATNGSDGTGGTLILIVGGNLTLGGSAVISANGSAGGNATAGSSSAGGGSGAGRVIVLYAGTLSNSGSIVATGGTGGTPGSGGGAGGNGGAGSITSPTLIAKAVNL